MVVVLLDFILGKTLCPQTEFIDITLEVTQLELGSATQVKCSNGLRILQQLWIAE